MRHHRGIPFLYIARIKWHSDTAPRSQRLIGMYLLWLIHEAESTECTQKAERHLQNNKTRAEGYVAAKEGEGESLFFFFCLKDMSNMYEYIPTKCRGSLSLGPLSN